MFNVIRWNEDHWECVGRHATREAALKQEVPGLSTIIWDEHAFGDLIAHNTELFVD